MDWIKKHYDQFALALLACLLLGLSIMLVLKAQGFGEAFKEAKDPLPQGEKLPPLPLERVDAAKATVAAPPQWVTDGDTRGTLFISQRFILGEDGNPRKPKEGSIYNDRQTGKPIPNAWFLDNNLPLLDSTVATQDPDKDGFNNEDEWRGQTNPNDKESHPPYHTKLFLKQYIKTPFRLIFRAYDGDIKKGDIKDFTFQIDTIDYKQPTEFLSIGGLIPNTKLQIKKFEYKTEFNEKIGVETDVSELTLVNTETKDEITLVLNRVVDSPDRYALFDYRWPSPPIEIKVRKLKEFALVPKDTERYKLVDINEAEALIQLPSGEKYTVRPYPGK